MGVPITFNEARAALERRLWLCLEADFRSGEIQAVPSAQAVRPDAKSVQCWQVFRPGAEAAGELGRNGHAPRLGVFVITFSAPNSPAAWNRAWDAAGEVEAAFRDSILPAGARPGASVFCQGVSVDDVGEIDGRRIISASVSWWCWTGGFERSRRRVSLEEVAAALHEANVAAAGGGDAWEDADDAVRDAARVVAGAILARFNLSPRGV